MLHAILRGGPEVDQGHAGEITSLSVDQHKPHINWRRWLGGERFGFQPVPDKRQKIDVWMRE